MGCFAVEAGGAPLTDDSDIPKKTCSGRARFGIFVAIFVVVALVVAGIWCIILYATSKSKSTSENPGTPPETPPAPFLGKDVACEIKVADKRKMLLASSGFGHPSLMEAFRTLVLKLPKVETSDSKQQARNRTLVEVKKSNFFEPSLYKDLKVVVVNDPCFFKAKFWEDADPSGTGIGLNYKSAGVKTSLDNVKSWVGDDHLSKLDGGWCYDFRSDGWTLRKLGFERAQIQQVNIFDALAKDPIKETLFKIFSKQGSAADLLDLLSNENSYSSKTLDSLESADILVFNGGNPDFANFVLNKWPGADNPGNTIKKRVKEGHLLYIGQSAGSMAAGADVGLSIEGSLGLTGAYPATADPWEGAKLAGRCAVRPHSKKGDKWEVLSAAYSSEGRKVLQIPNDSALQCIAQDCRVVGKADANAGTEEQLVKRLRAVLRRNLPA